MRREQGLRNLVSRMAYRQRAFEKPFVLLLGAGASQSSGGPTDEKLRLRFGRDFVKAEITEENQDVQELISSCWETLPSDDRYSFMKQHLPARSPSAGYQSLADLVKGGYFHIILTTNWEQLLEDALFSSGLRGSEFQVVIPSVLLQKACKQALETPNPPIKIVKLHGDLGWRIFAWLDAEKKRYTRNVASRLAQFLKQDIVVVGSSLQDPDILKRLAKGSASLWHVSPHGLDESVVRELKKRELHQITGKLGRFDNFFGKLRSELLGAEIKEKVGPPADTEAQLSVQLADSRRESIFKKTFKEKDLDLGLIAGIAHHFPEGFLALGSPGQGSILIVPGVQLTNLVIETRFQILDDGGNDSNWAGFLIRASNPFLGGGYLVYFRSNGNVELQYPTGALADSRANIKPPPKDRPTSARIEVYKSMIRLFVEQDTKPLISWSGEEIRPHGQGIFLHTFGTDTKFHYLQFSRIVTP